jgi:Cu/Ag efflux pump CusA
MAALSIFVLLKATRSSLVLGKLIPLSMTTLFTSIRRHNVMLYLYRLSCSAPQAAGKA